MKDVLPLAALLAAATCPFAQDQGSQDEPVEEGPKGLQLHDERAFDGYTLFAPLNDFAGRGSRPGLPS